MKETAMDKPALRAQAELLAKLRKKRTGKTVDQIMQQLEREEMKREFDAAKAIRVQVKLKASGVKKGIKKGKKVAKCIIYDESWEGYSDEAGSVESGVLDENVCCDCGIKTNRKKECDELVLCDVCDSEYHIKCVGLERTRTRALAWTCPRCVEERTHFSSLSFSGGKKFQVYTNTLKSIKLDLMTR